MVWQAAPLVSGKRSLRQHGGHGRNAGRRLRGRVVFSGSFAILDEIRMAGFMYQADEVNGVPFDLVADVVWKRAAVFAGKTVWTDMIAAFPTDNCPHRILDSFVKVAAESIRDGKIPGFRIQQVPLEER